MDVLVTCLNYPYPLENGENLRIYHYVRTLRSRHNFDLICLGDGEPPAQLKQLFRRIDHVQAPRETAESASLLDRIGASFSLDHFCPPIPALRAALEKALAAREYDLVWTSADIFPSLPCDRKQPVLGDIVDDLVVQYGSALKTTKLGLPYLRLLKRTWMARTFERRYFSKAEACLFVSEVDAAVFSRICPGNLVRVIHNGVDAEYFQPNDLPIEADSVVFEGSMDFYPNIDGAIYLCNEVMPLVRKRRPGVKTYIVGKKPTRSVQALASADVIVTGFVEDVRPYLARAALFVSPTRTGAGIKNKILQAWAMGKAVVATSASTGGLRCRDGDNILVRDTTEGLADAIVTLLDDSPRRSTLGIRGRQTIVDHYTWEAKARELEDLMLAIISAMRKEAAHA